ncbi:MAG: Na+/H+ antiporter subunit G [Gammaproteobacteria bacterium]
MPPWAEVLMSVLLLTGAAFALIGAYGLVKLSDYYRRLHGPTKATTLGVGAVLAASSLYFSLRDPGLSLHELLIALFLFITAPVSAHMLAKAALHLDPSARPPPPQSQRQDPT